MLPHRPRASVGEPLCTVSQRFFKFPKGIKGSKPLGFLFKTLSLKGVKKSWQLPNPTCQFDLWPASTCVVTGLPDVIIELTFSEVRKNPSTWATKGKKVERKKRNPSLFQLLSTSPFNFFLFLSTSSSTMSDPNKFPNEICPVYAPFFGVLGAASAIIFTCKKKRFLKKN